MTPEILEKLLNYIDADFYGDKKDALKSELRELVRAEDERRRELNAIPYHEE